MVLARVSLDARALHQRQIGDRLGEVVHAGQFQAVQHALRRAAIEQAEQPVVIGECAGKAGKGDSPLVSSAYQARALEIETVRAGQAELAVRHRYVREVRAELFLDAFAVYLFDAGTCSGCHGSPPFLFVLRKRRHPALDDHAQLAVECLAHEFFGDQLHVVDGPALRAHPPPKQADTPRKKGERRKPEWEVSLLLVPAIATIPDDPCGDQQGDLEPLNRIGGCPCTLSPFECGGLSIALLLQGVFDCLADIRRDPAVRCALQHELCRDALSRSRRSCYQGFHTRENMRQRVTAG